MSIDLVTKSVTTTACNNTLRIGQTPNRIEARTRFFHTDEAAGKRKVPFFKRNC
ncbi:hypothetical protein GcC1_048028 [Golovinomyces cichoracearum]|uniref:Uncharacterized protein n=1 Tax=Golovinomyces cichoracearum TaxID=62708 RepID=A0A420IXB7_9PEZI|nr:hypothetical protein GcC1_048028 [Golovinomyces cichoracearum]